MTRARQVFGRRLASGATVARITQGACFVAGPAILIVSLRILPKFAGSPGEIFLGVLSSSAVALLLVVMGMVLPIPQGSSDA